MRARRWTPSVGRHTGGRGASVVRCVDCKWLYPRAEAVKYRARGWPAFFRCLTCAAAVRAHLAYLFSLPLLPDA